MDNYRVVDKRGAYITAGDTVTDFRGDRAKFVRVAAAPVPGKSAKVTVELPSGVDMTYYAEVFNLAVIPPDFEVEIGAYGIPSVPPENRGVVTCGDCGRAWIQDVGPSARCPFEHLHEDFEFVREVASYELATGYALRVRYQDDTREYVSIHGDDGISSPVLLEMSWEDFKGMTRHFSEVAGL